jgi:hypothetical protein
MKNNLQKFMKIKNNQLQKNVVSAKNAPTTNFDS